MNQQCKVCGEPAAGFHFGAFTCEGCKVRDLFNHRLNAYCPIVYSIEAPAARVRRAVHFIAALFINLPLCPQILDLFIFPTESGRIGFLRYLFTFFPRVRGTRVFLFLPRGNSRKIRKETAATCELLAHSSKSPPIDSGSRLVACTRIEKGGKFNKPRRMATGQKRHVVVGLIGEEGEKVPFRWDAKNACPARIRKWTGESSATNRLSRIVLLRGRFRGHRAIVLEIVTHGGDAGDFLPVCHTVYSRPFHSLFRPLCLRLTYGGL